MILKILKLHPPEGLCNFENFQNHLYLLITNCTWGRAISYTNFDFVQEKHIWWLSLEKLETMLEFFGRLQAWSIFLDKKPHAWDLEKVGISYHIEWCKMLQVEYT